MVRVRKREKVWVKVRVRIRRGHLERCFHCPPLPIVRLLRVRQGALGRDLGRHRRGEGEELLVEWLRMHGEHPRLAQPPVPASRKTGEG